MKCKCEGSTMTIRAPVDRAKKILQKRAEVARLQESVAKARQRIAGAKAELSAMRKQK
jgi:hypothetical protein